VIHFLSSCKNYDVLLIVFSLRS